MKRPRFHPQNQINGTSSPAIPPQKFHPHQRHRHPLSVFIWRRPTLIRFVLLGAFFIISVHLYLIHTFFHRTHHSDESFASAIPQAPNLRVSVIPPPQNLTTAPSFPPSPLLLTPLQTKTDFTHYTLRINTYRRNEQLLISLNHHATCEGIVAIHVIWCDNENDPPDDVVNHVSGKVTVERHEENTLNERFRMLILPQTAGVLSLDDDIIRPCVAYDAGFFRWTRAPERMLGYDARRHIVNDDKVTWKYGYMSTTEKSNLYSMSLPRSCFIHRDYLHYYTTMLPRAIYNYVNSNMNCEDIAMSFMISALTGGDPPLLADYWAVKSRVKLYVKTSISGTDEHKSVRDYCVNMFSDLLDLKDKLRLAKLGYGGYTRYGDQPENVLSIYEGPMVQRHYDLVERVEYWTKQKQGKNDYRKLMKDAEKEAQAHGLLLKTKEWQLRWNNTQVVNGTLFNGTAHT